MRLLHLLGFFITFAASPAQAHVTAEPGSQAWLDWHPDPWIVTAILLTVVLYVVGLIRLWVRSGVGRGVGKASAIFFLVGIAMLLVALASPLERMAGALLTAHMVQHVILIAVVPPLMVFGRPDVVFVFALPRRARRGAALNSAIRVLVRTLRPCVRPLPAALIHGAAVWIWHAPGLFQAALSNVLLHDLEHASFFFTGLAFWYATLLSVRSPTALIAGVMGIVLTLIQGGLMGALMTLTPTVLYPAYGQSTATFGLTPIEDQQLAGLIMWVPAGAIYLIAGLYLATCLLDVTEKRSRTVRFGHE